MTDTDMKVTQADREAADEFAGKAYLSILAHEALEVAFARHRESVITAAMAQDKAEIERLREALEAIKSNSEASLCLNCQQNADDARATLEARNVTDT